MQPGARRQSGSPQSTARSQSWSSRSMHASSPELVGRQGPASRPTQLKVRPHSWSSQSSAPSRSSSTPSRQSTSRALVGTQRSRHSIVNRQLRSAQSIIPSQSSSIMSSQTSSSRRSAMQGPASNGPASKGGSPASGDPASVGPASIRPPASRGVPASRGRPASRGPVSGGGTSSTQRLSTQVSPQRQSLAVSQVAGPLPPSLPPQPANPSSTPPATMRNMAPILPLALRIVL